MNVGMGGWIKQKIGALFQKKYGKEKIWEAKKQEKKEDIVRLDLREETVKKQKEEQIVKALEEKLKNTIRCCSCGKHGIQLFRYSDKKEDRNQKRSSLYICVDCRSSLISKAKMEEMKTVEAGKNRISK